MSIAKQLGRFLLSVASLAGVPKAAFAHPQFAEQIPNRATAKSPNTGEQRPCITCHNNPDGGQGCPVFPCFNPFGQAFQANGKVWTYAFSQLDSDGDGFTNGQELQDPTGSWVYASGQPAPGLKAYVTRPGFDTDSPGLNDKDQDRVCWFGNDSNSDGDCIDAGEKTNSFDCNDDDALTSSIASEVCSNAIDNNCNGLAPFSDPACATVMDNDGDGYCETGRDLNGDKNCLDAGEPGGLGDCNDNNSTVHPGAAVNCIDGIDNDCDALVDLDDVIDCDVNDDDGDLYCPAGRDNNGDGKCISPGEALPVSDCLDVPLSVNPVSAQISPAATEVCGDGLDNDCDGKADYTDSDCAHLVDADGDGFCPEGTDVNKDGNCGGVGEPSQAANAKDCDDANKGRSPALTEICYDKLDNDCDALTDLADTDCARFFDKDQDGFCPNGQDINANGNCIDFQVGLWEYQVAQVDCDDTSDIAKPRNSELSIEDGCFDGLDTDCDGLTDAFDFDCSNWADKDLDGFCPLGTDANSDRDCADPGEATESAQDCDDTNAAKSNGVQENCTDGTDNNCDLLVDKSDPDCRRDTQGDATDYPGDNDVDGDGYCPLGTDLNMDADCSDKGENVGSDCNDANPLVYKGAAENTVALCKDGIDNDCDGNADISNKSPSCALFVDGDNDGFCPRGQDRNFDGDCLDSGEQTAASDCDDTSPLASPIRVEICTDGIDNNCNDLTDYLDSSSCACENDSQCNDAVACTMDSCTRKKCTHEPSEMCMDGGVEPVADGGGGNSGGSSGSGGAGGAGSDGTDGEDAGAEERIKKKSPSCSVRAYGSGGASALGLAAALGLFILRRRRRST